MLKSSLCNYSDACILPKETITRANTAAVDADVNNTNKKVIFKNCAPFTDHISQVNNKQVANAKDNAVVLPMYNLLGDSNSYSKTSASLFQYYKDEPGLNYNSAVVEIPGDNTTNSFRFKEKEADQTGSNDTRNVKIMTSLIFWSNFLGTLEMPIIDCEINLFQLDLKIFLYHLMHWQLKQLYLQ